MGTFTLDPSGIRGLLVSPEMSAMLLGVVTEGVPIAEGLSADFVVTGHYASSFVPSVDIQERITGGPAAVGKLTNTASYSLAVEYGFKGRSGRNTRTAHKVLSRTAALLHL